MAEKGESRLLIDQIRAMSKEIFGDLNEIDNKLSAIIDDIKLKDEVDKDFLVRELRSIRSKIGIIEREDSEELKDEEILGSIIQKLDDLVDATL